jgi:hypothetical protein
MAYNKHHAPEHLAQENLLLQRTWSSLLRTVAFSTAARS